MKVTLLYILLLSGLWSYAQEERGKLLLFRVDLERDLTIEKNKFAYLVLELDNKGNLKDNAKSERATFDGFTDSNIISCVDRDSIQLTSVYVGDTFEHEKIFQAKYLEVLEKFERKMNNFMNLNVKSDVIYNENIKISYILLNAHYCKGKLANRDSKMMDVGSNVVIIIDELIFDNVYKIPKEKMYDVVKAIDFNSFMY